MKLHYLAALIYFPDVLPRYRFKTGDVCSNIYTGSRKYEIPKEMLSLPFVLIDYHINWINVTKILMRKYDKVKEK